MRFKLDENIPLEAIGYLQNAGMGAVGVEEEGLAGSHDPAVADACRIEDRVLITMDVGFGDIRTYPPGSHPGIVVLRLARQDTPAVIRVLRRVIDALKEEPVSGNLWVVDENRIRVREDGEP